MHKERWRRRQDTYKRHLAVGRACAVLGDEPVDAFVPTLCIGYRQGRIRGATDDRALKTPTVHEWRCSTCARGKTERVASRNVGAERLHSDDRSNKDGN